MGIVHHITVEYTNGTSKIYVKICYQFKKTKMYRQLIQMLNDNKIKNFTY